MDVLAACRALDATVAPTSPISKSIRQPAQQFIH